MGFDWLSVFYFSVGFDRLLVAIRDSAYILLASSTGSCYKSCRVHVAAFVWRTSMKTVTWQCWPVRSSTSVNSSTQPSYQRWSSFSTTCRTAKRQLLPRVCMGMIIMCWVCFVSEKDHDNLQCSCRSCFWRLDFFKEVEKLWLNLKALEWRKKRRKKILKEKKNVSCSCPTARNKIKASWHDYVEQYAYNTFNSVPFVFV